MAIVTLGYEYFPDFTVGRPVFNGSIYIGEPDTDPEIPANQKDISVRQEDGTEVSVSQPVTTSAGGVPIYNGSPVGIVTNGDYSLKVLNSSGSQVYYLSSLYSGEMPITTSDGIIQVDTVSDMISSTTITVGSIVRTLGYLEKGDAGGNLYEIVESGTGVDDGGSYIDLTTHQAKALFPEGKVNVRQFGASGAGTSDDSEAIQSAIDYVETISGALIFPFGDYRVTATKGTNDKYGIKIDNDNVSLVGEAGASLRRLSSDISTYALSFPILLVGAPDSNSTKVSNIKVEGLKFIGEDTRHASSGSALMDGRQAIWLKNVDGASIKNNEFTSIDSSAIWTQSPAEFDYENSQYYNTTKCYNIDVSGNRFIAESHATPGRALLHAVVTKGDIANVSSNIFEWCDVCVDCENTYNNYSDKETDTYTDTNLGQAVQRTGKGVTIDGNTVYNASEHCFYLNGMGVTCSGNSITVDDISICNTSQIQTRGRGLTITGNNLVGVAAGFSISTGSQDVTVSGNSVQSIGDSAAGVVNIQSQGLTAYIDSCDCFNSYLPMKNIVVSGNVLNQKNASQTDGVGIRVFTDTTDANFPDGQMQNVVISSNTINRPKKAILSLSPMARRVLVHDNIFNGKDFAEAGFSVGTSMDSLAVLAVDDAYTTPLNEWSFDNNKVYGFEYICYDDGGTGSGMSIPRGVRGNTMDYIKYWDTSAFTQPTFDTRFRNNSGVFFLDRTGWFSTTALENSLSDGTSNTDRKGCMLLVGAGDTRLYYDDSGNFNAL